MTEREEKLLIAQNPDSPPEALRRLSEDPDFWVRLFVLINPNTPTETYDSLTERLGLEIYNYFQGWEFMKGCLWFFFILLGITVFRIVSVRYYW
jgi:hypothetical protein